MSNRASIACLILVTFSGGASAQKMAVPMGVRDIVASPPRVGALMQISGQIKHQGKDYVLQEPRGSKRILLSVGQGTVDSNRLLEREKPTSVEITGRMKDLSADGTPVVEVIGVSGLMETN